MRPLLDNPNEPINDLSYYDCLDGVTDKSKVSFIHYLSVLMQKFILSDTHLGPLNYF